MAGKARRNFTDEFEAETLLERRPGRRSVRTFTIGDAGIAVGDPFAGVEAVLDAMAREAVEGTPAAPSEGDDQGSSKDGIGRSG